MIWSFFFLVNFLYILRNQNALSITNYLSDFESVTLYHLTSTIWWSISPKIVSNDYFNHCRRSRIPYFRFLLLLQIALNRRNYQNCELPFIDCDWYCFLKTVVTQETTRETFEELQEWRGESRKLFSNEEWKEIWPNGKNFKFIFINFQEMENKKI